MTEPNSSPPPDSEGRRPPAKALDHDQIRALLAECEGVDLPETADEHTLLVIDSYTAIWIQHLLEERHGIVADISGRAGAVDSISALLTLVNRDLGAGHA